MPTPRLAAVAPALALALALPLAGCSGGGEGPRLVVGDGPPADQWGLLDGDGDGARGSPAPPSRPPPTPTRAPEPEPDRGRDRDRDRHDGDDGDDGDDGGDEDPDGGADGGSGPGGPLVAFAAGDDPGTYVVASHAAGADWSEVAAAADAGAWTLVVEGGTPGQYAFGEGLVATPDPGTVRDGDRLRFCDRSTVDGVTASYVQVEAADGGVLLRERIQPAPC